MDLPIENGDFPCFLYVYQRVNPIANHIYHIYPIYPPIHLSIYLSNYLQPMHAAEAPERALRELEAPRPQWRIRRGSPQLILLGAHTWWQSPNMLLTSFSDVILFGMASFVDVLSMFLV